MKSQPICIEGATIVTARAEIRDRSLLIEAGRIAGLVPSGADLPAGCLRIDAAGLRVTPGLIDTHVSGAAGRDCREGPDAIRTIARALAQRVTTAWLPTPYSVPTGELEDAVGSLRGVLGEPPCGAVALGLHVEGPYFLPAWRGMARQEYLCEPDARANQRLLDKHADLIRMVTVAPDVEGIGPLIRQYAMAGIVVAAAHTAADRQQIAAAIDAGLSHVTHLANAMADRGRAEPGVVKPGTMDFCLLADDLTVSVICDGVHVRPEIIDLVLRVKGVDRTVVITDLWPGAGCDAAEITYVTGEEVLIGDVMRLKDSGLIAGGITFLNKCAHNVQRFAGLSWPQTVRVASSNPARLAGAAGRKGDLRVGMDADVIVVDDAWDVRAVIVGGKIFKNELS